VSGWLYPIKRSLLITSPIDFRALCAELVDELHAYKVASAQHEDSLITRTRAALAEQRQKKLMMNHA
jgi:hypothetical protein